MSEPLVSVVTRATSQSDFEATLGSIAAQTTGDWELLLVGDSADDGARELAAAGAAEDPRVRHVVRPGACPAANVGRNAGIEAARSAFVVVLEAGDVLAPRALEGRAEIMARNADLDFAVFQPGALAGGPSAVSGPPQLGDDLCRFLYLDIPWTTAAVIWRRETLVRLGLFDDKLLGWQDLALQVRAITAGCHYARFPDVDHIAGRRRAPRSVDGALAAIARMEADVRGGPGMNWVRQRALSSLYFRVAERLAEDGDLEAAMAAWRVMRARRLGPAHLHAAGAAFLRLHAAGGELAGAWKRWARLSPEVAARGAPMSSSRSEAA